MTDAGVRTTRRTFELVLLGYTGLYLLLTLALGLGDVVHWIGFVVVPILLFRRLRPGEPLRNELALDRIHMTNGVLRASLIGLALSPVLLVGVAGPQDVLEAKTMLTYPIALALLLVTAATTEEVFFRGFLFHALLRPGRGPGLAVVGSALAFSAFHVAYVMTGAGQLSASAAAAALAFVTAFIGGLLLGWTMLRTRNLVACIAMHVALDGLAASTLIRVSFGP